MNRMISFEPLEIRHLELLHRWLNSPHVLEWWDNPGPSLERVQQSYIPSIEGREPTHCYLIHYDGTAIGFIQSYLIADHSEYAEQLEIEERAAGVDLYIGDPDYLHRGLGAPILRSFLRQFVFADPDIESCIIGPAAGNRIAIRAYEKAGFSYLKTVDVLDEPEPEYLMRITPDDLRNSNPTGN
jgi:RimJ/RimL family protein N-acetyltransferase